MLQQILREMYIEPELLAELDDEQKQILFCKIREEQVRRWKEREAAVETEERQNKNQRTENADNDKAGHGARVSFLEDREGQPWTWVMGEHPDDKSIERIIEEEAQQIARQQAESEAEERKNTTEDRKSTTKETVSQAVTQFSPSSSSVVSKAGDCRSADSLAVAMRTAPDDVESTKSRRSSEIFESLRLDRQRSAEQAKQEGKKIIEAWKEQERKAKQAEEERRVLARRAREDHVRAMRRLKTESQIIGNFMMTLHDIRKQTQETEDKPAPSGMRCPPGRQSRPADKDAVMAWFKDVEEPKGTGVDPFTNQLADYFYGFITRQDAEDLLSTKPPGSYLIRLSDRIWGYALSYRGDAKCKHYLIDASDGSYRFFGTNQATHRSLHDLVECHKTVAMSIVGNELLLHACGVGRQIDATELTDSPPIEIYHF